MRRSVPDDTAPADIAETSWTPPAWEALVVEHRDRVYRVAYRLTGNRHDAEDLTHDVFVRVFRSLDQYRPGSFEGWLYRITTSLFLDGVRRRRRVRFDPLLDEFGQWLQSREPDPETEVLGRFDAEVQAALAALPPDFRAAVVLCDVEGLAYEEIAAILEVPLGTVRSRLHRGRAQLRETLAHRRPTRGGVAVPRPRLRPAT
jgi:RNA polymerase sigma-70 factor (ECF subfamily)